MIGGQNHRDVSGEVGLRGQSVHLLGPRAARDHLHGDGRDALGRHGIDQPSLVEWVQKADVHRSPFERGDLVGFRLAHPQDDVRRAEQACPITRDGRTGFGVGGVRIPRRISRPGLYDDFEPDTDELLHALGNERRPLFPRPGFLGYPNEHAIPPNRSRAGMKMRAENPARESAAS